MTMLERVTIQVPVGEGRMFGFSRFDFKKIMALTNEEFSQFYLEAMQEYKDKNGWWQEGKMPSCGVCHEIIPGPAQLRRYYGRTLNAKCFRELWAKERNEHRKSDQQYFDRIAKLTLGE